MAFAVVQAGNKLYKVDPDTGTATELTLPTGVTLSTTRKPQFAVLNQWVVLVNSPTQNLAIDPEGVVRVMTPRSPQAQPIIASGGAGNVTGSITVKYTYAVKGTDGQLYMESPLSPQSQAFAASSNILAISNILASLEGTTGWIRRIYRTLAGGTVYYHVADIEDNVGTTLTHNLADAGVELLPVLDEILVSPPGTLPGTWMKTVIQWKSRLWGVSSAPDKVDEVVYCEENKVFAWPNTLIAYPTGQDREGVVGFAPRRDELGVLKRDGLWQITGGGDTFSLVQVQFGRGGCISPDTIVVINDNVYWLGDDGVWEWGPDGLQNVSDEQVAPWFKSDTYFNRSRFSYAFAKYNALRKTYDLHLAATGSSVEDRWVSFNIQNKKWYGPHKTGAFTPSAAELVSDGSGLPVALVGGTNGIVYKMNQATYHDGSSTLIDYDVTGPFHFANAPDIEHYWDMLSVLTKVQASGTLSITPTVGRLDTAAGSVISHDMTLGRQRLERMGVGAGLRLRFQQATADVGVTQYGYEIPFHEIGRR
jgi:hypothetical protein